jgi:hypothetical protein
MFQFGPYGPNHATAGTFAFRKELLNLTRYEDHAAVAEERAFLKDYTIPFVQLDPMKSILVFSHEHNTFDKRKMLKNPHPDYFKESPKTVDMFIRKPHESNIKSFFMKDIDALLDAYEPGQAKMKPDVLKQIKEIEDERERMVQEEMNRINNQPIVIQRPGEQPVQLTNVEVVNIINSQQEQLRQMQPIVEKLKEAENIINMLQKQLIEKTKETMEFKKKLREYENQNKNKTTEYTRIPIETTNNKSDPEITIDIDCQ